VIDIVSTLLQFSENKIKEKRKLHRSAVVMNGGNKVCVIEGISGELKSESRQSVRGHKAWVVAKQQE